MSRIILLPVVALICAPVFGQKAGSDLPPPQPDKSKKNFSNVIGWENGQSPTASENFQVTMFANGFENPRWLYVTENGDVLVAESNSFHPLHEKIGAVVIGANKSNNLKNSANRITLLRDTNDDGVPDIREPFLE